MHVTPTADGAPESGEAPSCQRDEDPAVEASDGRAAPRFSSWSETTLEPPEKRSARDDRIARVVGTFERGVVLALMGLLFVVITLSALNLGWLVAHDLVKKRLLLLDLEDMLELFGSFLLVLIGMELLTSMKSYLFERVIHLEVVLEVALVAVAQKVIILDASRTEGAKLIGLAGLIVALAAALWSVRARRRRRRSRPA
jgi:uncharacterized membrane protein (DUF373 family)